MSTWTALTQTSGREAAETLAELGEEPDPRAGGQRRV